MPDIGRGKKKLFSLNGPISYQTQPQILKLRFGTAWSIILGIPFLLFVGYYLTEVIRWHKESPLESPFLDASFYIAIGVLFIIGMALLYGRRLFILDKRRNLLTWWDGVLIHIRKKEKPLDRVKTIVITHSYHNRESVDPLTSIILYQVWLEGDRETLFVTDDDNYRNVSRIAERLAKFLSLPILDYSTDEAIIREPDRLDESLRERLKRAQEDTSFLPAPPLNMKTHIKEIDRGRIFDIPMTINLSFRSRVFWFGLLVVCSAFIAYAWISLDINFPTEPYEHKLAVIGFVGSFIYLIFRASLAAATKNNLLGQRAKVTVTPEFMRVEKRRLFRRKIQQFPADQILNTEVAAALPGHPARINIQRHAELIDFGSGLREDELQYLNALLRKILTSEPLGESRTYEEPILLSALRKKA